MATHRVNDDEEQLLVDRSRKRQKKVARAFPGAVPEEIMRAIQEKCSRRLSNDYLGEMVCCVCDCWHPKRDMFLRVMASCPVLIGAMKKRLKAPSGLPLKLMQCYDVSEQIPELGGLLLSLKGISNVDGRLALRICKPCYHSLVSKRATHAPKFAIANGLYIGWLPDGFNDTNVTEHAMLNLAQPTKMLAVVRGGHHTAIRAHAYYFRADPAPPASLLPREVVADGTIGVTMVGFMTSKQKAATFKRYDVRVPRLVAQLKWYTENNELFKSRAVSVCPDLATRSAYQQTQVVLDRCHEESSAPSTTVSQELDAACFRFNAPNPAHSNVTDVDETQELCSAALLTNFADESDSHRARKVLEKQHVLVRRSSRIVSDFDNAFWVYAFVELFPFGRGGLDEPRPVKISLREYLRYCLRLSSHRHARHHSFTLVAFDVLARHESMKAVYLRARMSPAAVAEAAVVGRDALVRHLENEEARIKRLSTSAGVGSMQPSDESIRSLYSFISTGMSAHYGSNEERSRARSDLLAMQLAYGQPSLFFTMSPSSSSSFRAAAFAGGIEPGLLEAMNDELHDSFAMSKAKLGAEAACNPMACARYYDEMVSLFIDVVLNFDTETQRSRSDCGVFGVTKAFFVSTESQNSTGDLHGHMLIWIEGMPTTTTEYYTLLQQEGYCRQVEQYVSSIARSSFPLALKTCPHCGSDRLSPVAIERQAFQKPSRGGKRSTTASCLACTATFGGSELIELELERESSRLGFDSRLFSDAAIHYRLAIPKPLDLLSPMDPKTALVITKALLHYQTHRWSHARSCFKPTKRTPKGQSCRMFFPKEVCLKTVCSGDGLLSLKRPLGSEYLNTYIPVVNAVLKMNHDIKFLSAGEGIEKAYYMMKYSTKAQNEVENPLAIHIHAFDKAITNRGDTTDSVREGRRVVQSMCCTLSQPQELSGPMAALFVLRSSPFYASCSFVKLFLASYVKAVFEDETMDVMLQPLASGVSYRPTSPLIDYVQRPVELQHICLLDFVQLWTKEKRLTGYHFVSEHKQAVSHSMFRREHAAVATIVGYKFPDNRNAALRGEELAGFQRAMLLLFLPFRSLKDVVPAGRTLDDVYRNWSASSAAMRARSFEQMQWITILPASWPVPEPTPIC